MTSLEKLAKELGKIYIGQGGYAVALHVQRLVLEAKIEQTDKIYGVCEKSRPVLRKGGTTTIVVLQTVEDYVRIKKALTDELNSLGKG